MKSKLDIIRKYFSNIETFVIDRESYAGLIHEKALFREFPNLVSKGGQERDIEGALKGMAMGKKILAWQKMEIQDSIERGDQLVVETTWTGEMAIEAGHLKKGQQLKAFCCMIFEFQDGKIFRQRNYDCYEPF